MPELQPSSHKIRIIIAGGGTGGHLFPGISIAEEFLEQRSCDIRFVGTKNGIEKRVIPQYGFKLYTLPVSGLYRVGIRKKIIALTKLPFAFLKSLWILLSFRPHLVVGVGGYASGPILALAVLLFKKTVIQEQNAFPGMTNRILGKYIRLSFIPFPQSKDLFKNPVVVGNPIRKAIKSAAAQTIQKTDDSFVITVVGGSQGAHVLNKTLINTLPLLEPVSNRIHIIHQTGKNDYQWICSEYSKYPGIKAEISEFIENMGSVYQKSNLLICRAGSMVNEIIAMGKASILVPIAVSSGNHQRENAKTMESAGASVMVEEENLNSQNLFDILNSFIDSPDKLKKMENNAKALYQGDAAGKIVNKTLEYYTL